MTIAIVVGLLVLMGYLDALTGYWLGAVLGRLVLAGIAVVVLLALAESVVHRLGSCCITGWGSGRRICSGIPACPHHRRRNGPGTTTRTAPRGVNDAERSV